MFDGIPTHEHVAGSADPFPTITIPAQDTANDADKEQATQRWIVEQGQ
jgi:hypothetical protein